MSITYEEALATLQSMFAEPWTPDTLDSVLRHQKGHMENTIDLILRHGNGDPQELVEQLESGVDPRLVETAADEELARQLSASLQIPSSSSLPFGNNNNNNNATTETTTPSNPRLGKGNPTTLADDFLRVPGFTFPQNSLSDDEALARMLQDELFTQELSRNPDFAHLATGRSGRASHTRTTTTSNNANSASATAGIVNPALAAANRIGEFARGLTGGGTGTATAAAAAGGPQQQRSASSGSNNPTLSPQPNLLEKISELGDTAKRRLQILAAQFNANKSGSGGGGGAAGTAGSGGEFRGLLEDDDNMELAARKDL
jgi:CUE domain